MSWWRRAPDLSCELGEAVHRHQLEVRRVHELEMQLALCDRRCADLEDHAKLVGDHAELVALVDEVTRRYFGANAERGRQMLRHELRQRGLAL